MKKWYTSKTLWVNAIAIIAGILADKMGVTLSSEAQVGILALINAGLRIITKEVVVW